MNKGNVVPLSYGTAEGDIKIQTERPGLVSSFSILKYLLLG